MMKKISILSIFASLLLCSCSETPAPVASKEGTLVITGLDVDVTEITKASSEAGGEYTITIYDGDSRVVTTKTYAQVRADEGKITLPAGDYKLLAKSTAGEVPVAAFEKPVYGVSKSFSITAGQSTSVGPLTCTLLQTKATVSYSDDFLAMVTGDCTASVSVTDGSPLIYKLSYNGGAPSFDQSAGYFAVPESEEVTMEIVFKGSIEGKSQKMTKVLTNVKARQWHQVKFVKKVDAEGTADIVISIDDFVQDVDLNNDLAAKEDIIGDDPKAPAGDGGIKLVSTCSFDITAPVVIPAMGEAFSLTMKAVVPNKVNRFTVEIASTNQLFLDAVAAVNEGSTTMDLVNPSSGAMSVFTTILPFPYGDKVYGKEEISFDLTDAQAPLLAFQGSHTFVMHVIDQQGCRKDISLVLEVK